MSNTSEKVQLDREAIEDAMFGVGWAADETRLSNLYSGRGMYGDRCAAIFASNESIVAQIIARLDDADQRMELAHRLKVDGAGTGIVAYFPGAEFDPAPPEDD